MFLTSGTFTERSFTLIFPSSTLYNNNRKSSNSTVENKAGIVNIISGKELGLLFDTFVEKTD